MKEHHVNDWLKLYYDTFSEATKSHGVEIPYTFELVQQMYEHHYEPEASFALVVLGLSFDKAQNDEDRQNILDRIESIFEPLRTVYE